MSPCSGHNYREKKGNSTQISNAHRISCVIFKDKATADLELQINSGVID